MTRDFAQSCVYQIYTKSFQDTNGNGLGDIPGVTKRLDYLKELGVDYIWMTPFFSSPMNDNGYDIRDYYQIDPAFGTMEELEELIAEANKRDIGLMFDMVFNHTSTEHSWFQKALAGDKTYQNYYFFREGSPETAPTNWISKFGGSAWAYVEELGQYYLHLFDKTQADLNWNNPAVREEMKAVLRFWKEKGIRGFRFDVVNLISKPDIWEDDTQGDGRRFYTDGPRVHEYIREMVVDTGLDADDIITVGEMSSTSVDHCIRYTRPEEHQLKMCFNFHHLKVDYKDGEKWALMPFDFKQLVHLFDTWQEAMSDNGGWNAVFWCNHDQPRAVSRFANDEEYREESAKMLATVIHGMRGTPYVYQGEEIGMTNTDFTDISQYRDVESLHYFEILKEQGIPEQEIMEILKARSRDNGRTPMQWSAQEHSGFTTGEPWLGVNQNYKQVNVEAAVKDRNSIFWHYQKLIALRKEYPVISKGDYIPWETGADMVFGYRRTLENQSLWVLANFSGEEKSVECEAADGRLLIGNYPSCQMDGGRVVLRAYEAVMLLRE